MGKQLGVGWGGENELSLRVSDGSTGLEIHREIRTKENGTGDINTTVII